ncbi:TetR/AcrR family transcriptional regulator [Paenibacillus sp. PR3]|uniref:TetR/AcrR family transcriptional regulator n=1 Tax=Paenibacillus terricola TaxID=2763503 RepID=A0ABR8MWL0_9BACL|nr:TetR/AcrR family transcriptional regulator [Paenibacillus terricola]MBD3920345.1 TetR/AcrR family transcriptional regulator [Paenibacillus terricola]
MQRVGNGKDRRHSRSQRLLKQSFAELMREKGFTAMTVKDIADRADVNRGTFYEHFPDKFALLEQSIRDKFIQLLEREIPPDYGWHPEHIRVLVQTVLEHVRTLYGRCSPIDTVNPLFEYSVRDELANLLRRWLGQFRADRPDWPVSVDTMALMTSWSIFGAAVAWSKGYEEISVTEMTDRILTVLTEGTVRFAGDPSADQIR